MEHMLLPGHVESWVLLLDFSGLQLYRLPTKVRFPQELAAALKLFRLLYSSRLYRGFVLNAGRSLWAKVAPLLSERTAKKFSVCREGEAASVLTVVNGDNLEKKYGGKGASPLSYWPPEFPVAPVFLPTEDPGNPHPALILRDSPLITLSDSPVFLPVRPVAVGAASPLSFPASDPETPASQPESSGGRTPNFESRRLEVENPFERLRSELSLEREDEKLACASCSFNPKSNCQVF